MAEMICRLLRDGALDGEYAPALTISDSIHNPFGSYAFNYLLSHLCSNISSSKSQVWALVLIAFDHSPLFYIDLLKSNGLDVAASDKWIRILDCYSDPLGWKDKLLGLGIHVNFSKTEAIPFKDVGNMEKLFTSIVDIGRGVAGPSKVRFSVAIDSVSAMLRHATLGSVSGLISKLRSHGMQLYSSEEFHMEQSGIKFLSVSLEKLMVNQNLVPKVQFNLHLSEKERVDKAKVVLPFEHQGACHFTLLWLQEMVKRSRFMMAGSPSPRGKLTPTQRDPGPLINLLLRLQAARARSTIFVILMMRDLILMRTQMMIWIFDDIDLIWKGWDNIIAFTTELAVELEKLLQALRVTKHMELTTANFCFLRGVGCFLWIQGNLYS
ncbi:hypothetical protein CKAN_02096400 [Cinnamomum micranthum f. kanehirae]|uniref:Elongator complex protein 5 n=1 Tax=Cinnamomum micranthum f. kanehirae TaxID=337451 RepID=A0A3S3NPJ6_9MAGN|nr:hypothetical protein CKAN_02096400 [Cinnamomum micranthum f. kanehirae]